MMTTTSSLIAPRQEQLCSHKTKQEALSKSSALVSGRVLLVCLGGPSGGTSHEVESVLFVVLWCFDRCRGGMGGRLLRAGGLSQLRVQFSNP